MLNPLSIALALVALTLLFLLLGGAGVRRGDRRRIRELESDILSLDERLTRDQKKRAGQTLQDGRRSNIEEAAIIAAAHKAQAPTASRMPGRANGITLNE